MRLLSSFVLLAFLTACAQEAPPPAADSNVPDMGPMPVVTALYDAPSPPTTLEQRQYSFTEEMAQALTAHEADVDWDFRSWANDPEVENITFGINEPETVGDRAGIVVRFTYPGIGGGMIVEYTLCHRDDGKWLINDIRGQSAEPGETDGPVSIRTALGLPETPPATC